MNNQAIDTPNAAAPAPEPGADGFVSDIPWQDDRPDCLVVCCSDHRFEAQTRDMVRHLNFSRPHVLQIPSGAALTLPLASAFNFLSKALDKIIERVVEMKQIREVILVGHQDCGAYKTERVPLIDTMVKRLTGKSVLDLQREHLGQAARRIKTGIRDVNVRTFFADVVGDGAERRVRFVEIPSKKSG
jgi:hypothetical protein